MYESLCNLIEKTFNFIQQICIFQDILGYWCKNYSYRNESYFQQTVSSSKEVISRLWVIYKYHMISITYKYHMISITY